MNYMIETATGMERHTQRTALESRRFHWHAQLMYVCCFISFLVFGCQITEGQAIWYMFFSSNLKESIFGSQAGPLIDCVRTSTPNTAQKKSVTDCISNSHR